jgi:TPR repeat protein
MNRFIFIFLFVILSNVTFANELEDFFQLAKTKDCDKITAFIGDSEDSNYFSAVSHGFGICTDKNTSKAIEYYRKSAMSGNVEAMYSFFVGVGQLPSAKEQTEELMKEAKVWLVKAGEKKHSGAATALGTFYKLGAFGFEKDEKKALYFENIAKLASPNK